MIVADLLAQIGHRFGFRIGNRTVSVQDLGLPSSGEIVRVLLQADGKKAPAAIYFLAVLVPDRLNTS